VEGVRGGGNGTDGAESPTCLKLRIDGSVRGNVCAVISILLMDCGSNLSDVSFLLTDRDRDVSDVSFLVGDRTSVVMLDVLVMAGSMSTSGTNISSSTRLVAELSVICGVVGIESLGVGDSGTGTCSIDFTRDVTPKYKLAYIIHTNEGDFRAKLSDGVLFRLQRHWIPSDGKRAQSRHVQQRSLIDGRQLVSIQIQHSQLRRHGHFSRQCID
jgi:hypothetical protein